MTVKSIFKTLIGTVVIIVFSSFLIELFNISITGMQIRQMTKMAAKQACVLFTQETYKTGGGKGAVNLPDVVAADGTVYTTGNFYGSDTRAEKIWSNIFNTSDFIEFCRMDGRYSDTKPPAGYSGEDAMYKAFPDLEILALSSGAKTDLNVENATVPSWNDSADSPNVINYNKKIKAQGYRESMFTTVNLGIPYMDDTIVSKMFKWNAAQILSNTLSSSIQQHEITGQYFVNYKGFECYANQARIEDYTYRCYNLNDPSDRLLFSQVSNMLVGGGNLGTGYDRADNNIVTVVGIKYSIPISYRGITPIRNIFNYVWDNEVQGMEEDEYTRPEHYDWNYNTEKLEAGGTFGESSEGTLSTLGELTYILVR